MGATAPCRIGRADPPLPRYFKRFDVPALVRAGIPLDASRLSHSHSNNTLVIEVRAGAVALPVRG